MFFCSEQNAHYFLDTSWLVATQFSYSQSSGQIVSILLAIFSMCAGCLLVYCYCFPGVVFANEGVEVVRGFFLRVVESAREVNGK